MTAKTLSVSLTLNGETKTVDLYSYDGERWLCPEVVLVRFGQEAKLHKCRAMRVVFGKIDGKWHVVSTRYPRHAQPAEPVAWGDDTKIPVTGRW